MEITVPKNTPQIKPNNYEGLQKLPRKKCSENEYTEITHKSQRHKTDWRHLPPCEMDVMIISSYGDETCPSIDVAPKLQDNTTLASKRMSLVHTELDTIQDLSRKCTSSHLGCVCLDFPGAQITKDCCIERIIHFLQHSKKGAFLWYTGNSERGTGNWCFKDGVITFDDIFGLYMDHFRGKRLSIISDCSYSGTWIRDCAKKLDEMGIPSCGHHMREQKILLNIYTACEENQEATISVLATAIQVKDGSMHFPGYGRQLASTQKSCTGDFRCIRCCRKASEACRINSSQLKWEHCLFNYHLIYLVQDGDKRTWFYVLVDKDKVDAFKARNATDYIDVTNYGKLLCCGLGQYPPDEKKKMIQMLFDMHIK